MSKKYSRRQPNAKSTLIIISSQNSPCKVNQALLVNQLLRGLLAQDPALRLSADEALQLPVFDDFRGTMLPYPEPYGKICEFEDNFDTFFEDEVIPVGSIQSLESRSRMIGPGDDAKELSLFSVRYEGQDPAMYAARQLKKGHGPNGGFESLKSSLLQSSHFHGSSQASGMHSGSQMSWKDDISPLTSPQIQLRMISKQQSSKAVERRPEGLAQFLVSPSKFHSNLHIQKKLDKPE